MLDTHAWIWWVNGRGLSARATRAVRRAVDEGAVAVSSISAWEVALLAARGRLTLAFAVAEWVARSEALPFLRFVPVDNAIALRAVALPALHADPADRIIVATALALGAPLVTRDERLRTYRGLRTVW